MFGNRKMDEDEKDENYYEIEIPANGDVNAPKVNLKYDEEKK